MKLKNSLLGFIKATKRPWTFIFQKKGSTRSTSPLSEISDSELSEVKEKLLYSEDDSQTENLNPEENSNHNDENTIHFLKEDSHSSESNLTSSMSESNILNLKQESTPEVKERNFPALQWNQLIRNAKDGGANSVLAANVLGKTSVLLKSADKVVCSMVESSTSIKDASSKLNDIATEIKSISQHTRIVALNLSIESARSGAAGRTFKIAAEEMQRLSNRVNNLTVEIEGRLEEIDATVKINDEKCEQVAITFRDVHGEVSEFNSLMMRIEELATTQASELNDFEKTMVSDFNMTSQIKAVG